MSTFTDKIATLNERLSEIGNKIVQLDQRRRDNSYDASQGNKTALKAIAAVDTEAEQLYREQQTLSQALDAAEQLAKDEQQLILDKQEHERQREAHSLAGNAASLNQEIDQLLVQLRQALERRAEQLNQLARMHVIDMGYLTRMGKDAITAGFCAAGLHRFADIRTPAPTSIRALATANQLLGSIGGAYVKVPRVKLNE